MTQAIAHRHFEFRGGDSRGVRGLSVMSVDGLGTANADRTRLRSRAPMQALANQAGKPRLESGVGSKACVQRSGLPRGDRELRVATGVEHHSSTDPLLQRARAGAVLRQVKPLVRTYTENAR